MSGLGIINPQCVEKILNFSRAANLKRIFL